MKVLVAGGTGFAGSAVCRRLAAAGCGVWSVSRSGAEVGPGVTSIMGDVLQAGGLAGIAAVPPVDWMVCALSGTGQADAGNYRRMYEEGPVRVAEAVRWAGARRVLFLGSTGVYGGGNGDWVTEATAVHPLHRAGGVQVAAEAAVRAAADQSIILRLSGLYGPGRTRMIRQALRMRPYLKPEVWANQIHRDDVAGVVAQLLALPEAEQPDLLLGSDDCPARRREIFDWIRTETGYPEGCYDEDHPQRATRERGNKRVSNARLRALGLSLQHPDYRSGLVSLLSRRASSSS